MSSIKVVLDTNIIISAILFGGKPRQILQWIIQGKINAFISPAMLTDFKEVLVRPKFCLTNEECYAIIKEIEDLFFLVFPKRRITLIKDDPDDNAILECAFTADVEYIISGDHHLLNFDSFEGVKIIPLAKFFQINL